VNGGERGGWLFMQGDLGWLVVGEKPFLSWFVQVYRQKEVFLDSHNNQEMGFLLLLLESIFCDYNHATWSIEISR